MSAFNILKAVCICPICGKSELFSIQFKYGSTWQYEYKIGETLRWGGNQIGVQTNKPVQVEAIGGPCPNCATDYIEFNIMIKWNVIERAIPLGLKRLNGSPEGFEIIE
jgi:hypothetical protein